MKHLLVHRTLSVLLTVLLLLSALSVFYKDLDFGFPKISFGIDLIGGGQIVMQVDSVAVEQREIASIQAFFESTHTLMSSSGSLSYLEFIGGDLSAADKEKFATAFPSLVLAYSPLGFTVSAPEQYLAAKVGQALVDNIGTLRSRLNGMGVADISIFRQGSNKIVIEFPAGGEVDRIKAILSSSAEVGFYEFVEQGDGVVLSDAGSQVIRALRPIVSGQDITRAIATTDPSTGFPVVSITLSSDGGTKMGDFTAANVGRPIITTLTDSYYSQVAEGDSAAPQREKRETVVSVATINGVFSSNFMISGVGSPKETENLALILRSGALSAPMFIVAESSIDARLGGDNAQRGFVAFVLGLLFLACYVVWLYRQRGLLTILSLAINAALIVVALSVLGASLTLAGLAGIILTMGMAVDANIIVNEREKELIGSSLTPMADAYKSSALPILDANATTLLVAVILYDIASVSLKGFAITLALGVVSTVVGSYLMSMYIAKAWMREDTEQSRTYQN